MLRTVSTATLVALLSSTSAFALEGKALLEKIVADSPAKIAYGSVEETGAQDLTLRDVRIENGATVATMRTLTFEGLREDGERVAFDRSTSEALEAKFPFELRQDERRQQVESTLRIASGTSENVLAPAGAIFALTAEGLSGLKGRMDVGSYTLNDITADFDGDGTFETSMAKVALADLSSPLEFRYDAKTLETAEGPAPEPLTLGSFSIEGTKVATGEGELTLDSVSLSDLDLPATLAAGPEAWMKTYSSFSMGPLQFAAEGKPLVKIESVRTDITQGEGTAIGGTSTVEGIFVDAATLAGPNAGALRAIGYETFTGRMEGVGSYDAETGVLALDTFKLDIDEAAELAMSYRISGYTPDLARRLNEISAQVNTAGQPADTQANRDAMMQVISELKVESATVELKDDSLTPRLLKFQSERMNTTPDQLATGAPVLLGLGMAQLGMPQFTGQVSSAVGTFLKDPGTLAVSAQPVQPVSVRDILVAAQQAPKSIVRMLNVTVEAK